MRLDAVLAGIEYECPPEKAEIDIGQVRYDSRRVEPGDLFVCISGQMADGNDFIPEALRRGAAALLTDQAPLLPADAPEVAVVLTADCRLALAQAAANLYGEPSRELHLVGVTGTNGKTTVTHFIRSILEQGNWETGLMGTLYAQMAGKSFPMERTTPEAVEIEAFLRYCRERGARYAVMEVSSHALELKRVARLHFSSALFINLTQDHLDYHQTMEAYLAAKLELFHLLPANGRAVINADSPAAENFRAATTAPVMSFGIDRPADVKISRWRGDAAGTNFTVQTPRGPGDFTLPLPGKFNLYNALAALTWALSIGLPEALIREALAHLAVVPGRFERVAGTGDFTVIVDYAHTPDGLQNVLAAAREITAGRLITVFGCGGNRDRGKRPLMGSIAGELSDISVVTSDNPRDEEPESIIDDIVAGIPAAAEVLRLSDRRVAIAAALRLAAKGDVVVVAGKGHEAYQLIRGRKVPFDDRQVVRELMEDAKKRGRSCSSQLTKLPNGSE
jgi:UDP-N-acetylmuramoyl-L-alanyl-D-glutamate--2,6-diaminopimelate ligase